MIECHEFQISVVYGYYVSTLRSMEKSYKLLKYLFAQVEFQFQIKGEGQKMRIIRQKC
jgi:hypothetical protein